MSVRLSTYEMRRLERDRCRWLADARARLRRPDRLERPRTTTENQEETDE